MSFEINNDLYTPQWNRHNQFHILITAVLTIPFWWLGIAVMTLWEIGDGFKPWWYDFKPSGHKFRDWFVSNFMYSDKFSLQDVLIWNMSGLIGGLAFRYLMQLIL